MKTTILILSALALGAWVWTRRKRTELPPLPKRDLADWRPEGVGIDQNSIDRRDPFFAKSESINARMDRLLERVK